MSTSPAISNNNSKRGERRGRRRETLNHYVVLVFFGQDNWGKLINMSESGLAFEFSVPPSPRERVNFTLQVMGCMPMPHDASVLGESFEAAGEIVWAREFESVAGLQPLFLRAGSSAGGATGAAGAVCSSDACTGSLHPSPSRCSGTLARFGYAKIRRGTKGRV
jgi:hypothetical protein